MSNLYTQQKINEISKNYFFEESSYSVDWYSREYVYDTHFDFLRELIATLEFRRLEAFNNGVTELHYVFSTKFYCWLLGNGCIAKFDISTGQGSFTLPGSKDSAYPRYEFTIWDPPKDHESWNSKGSIQYNNTIYCVGNEKFIYCLAIAKLNLSKFAEKHA